MRYFLAYSIILAALWNPCLPFPSRDTQSTHDGLSRPRGTEQSITNRAVNHGDCTVQQWTIIARASRHLLRLTWAGIVATRRLGPGDFIADRFANIFTGMVNNDDTLDSVHQGFWAVYQEALKTYNPSQVAGPNNLQLICSDLEDRCTGGRVQYATLLTLPLGFVLVSAIDLPDVRIFIG